jgi:hypothetical protein
MIEPLCWRENIGGLALYVNGKVSTIYAVIGVGYGGRLVPARHRSRSGEAGGRAVKGREVYLFNDGIYCVLRLFWLNLDKAPR